MNRRGAQPRAKRSLLQALRDRLRPRLGLVLLSVQLLVLILPVGGILTLRIYESALVRQTENALVAQAAILSASFRERLEQQPDAMLKDCRPEPPVAPNPDAPWKLRAPTLDLASDRIWPPSPTTDSPLSDTHALGWAARAADNMSAVMEDAQLVTLAGMRILDCHGVVIASTVDDIGHSLRSRHEVLQALLGEDVSIMRKRKSKPDRSWGTISRSAGLRVVVAMPIAWRSHLVGAVVMERTPATVIDTLYGKRHVLIAVGILLLALVAGLAFLTAFFLSWPLKALQKQVAAALTGQRGAFTPLQHSGTQEVQELSTAIATLATTLEQRADYISRFAQHVSHEFKTPLTGMRGALELLLDHSEDMPTEQRQRFLSNALADVERLQRLVNSLLELARADVSKPSGSGTDLLTVIHEQAERYRADGLDIELHCPHAVHIAVEPELVESILTNLLDNARQHGGERVLVQLSTQLSEKSAQLLLTVKDNGPGISAGNRQRIFEPFFTTARDHGGTGLGLPTVRALLLAHGGDIRLVDSAVGACFEVLLPVSSTDV